MDKINLGSTIPAYPMPVSLVGTHVHGKPNFLAVAWFSMAGYKPPRISITLGKGHYSNPGASLTAQVSVSSGASYEYMPRTSASALCTAGAIRVPP